jgi:hypothetical protein
MSSTITRGRTAAGELSGSQRQPNRPNGPDFRRVGRHSMLQTATTALPAKRKATARSDEGCAMIGRRLMAVVAASLCARRERRELRRGRATHHAGVRSTSKGVSE